MSAKTLRRVLTSIVWLTVASQPPERTEASPVRLWFSLSGADPYLYDFAQPSAESPRAVSAYLAEGSTAKLYLWGRPQTQNLNLPYDAVNNPLRRLQNLSLNLVAPGSNPAIDVASFLFDNPVSTGQKRFGTVIDSSHTVTVNGGIPNAQRTYPDFSDAGVERVAAYTLTTPSPYSGVGPTCGVGVCVTNPEPAWRLGSFDVDALQLGVAGIWLQVGSLSITHSNEAAPTTFVRFGEDTVTYDAASDRNVTLSGDLLPEAEFRVVSPLAGDYNDDDRVDAADYTVWRDNKGSTKDLHADGDGNLSIGPGDYNVWRATYGEVLGGANAAPEPGAGVLVAALLAGLVVATRRRQGARVAVGATLALLVAVGPAPAALLNANWNVAASGLWTQPTNWDTPTYPDNGIDTYNVTIGPQAAPPYVVTLDGSATVDGLALTDPDATLNVIDGTLSVNNLLEPFGGTLSLSGTSANFQSMAFTPILVGRSLVSQTSDTSTVVAFGLDNQGTVDVSSGTLQVFASDFIQNSGVFHVGDGARLELYPSTPYEHTGAAVLSGSGTFANDSNASGSIDLSDFFTNSAYVSPGDSPGILTIDSNYAQTASGTLEIEVGGLAAGTQHDRLVVSGGASLAGRLELAMTGGFNPANNDEVTILTAASVSGGFDFYHVSDLPSTIAQRLVYNAGDVRVQFVTPTTTTFTATGATVAWATAFGGSAPDSADIVSVFNNTPLGTPQTVVVGAPPSATTPNAAHSLAVGGSTGDITVSIDSQDLSVSTATTIKENGVIEVAGTGRLATETLRIEGGGRFTGTGTLIGDVEVGSAGAGDAVFDPVVDLTLEGDYTQTATGRLAIDISGPNTGGQHDLTSVTGDVSLAGSLVVDVSGLANGEFMFGDEYTILTTEGTLTGEFDHVSVVGRSDIYVDVIYNGASGPGPGHTPPAGLAAVTSQPSASLMIEMKGDGNKDYVVDEIDAQIFTAMLLDNNLISYDCDGGCSTSIASVNFFGAFEFVDTTPNNDVVVDFYDIPGFVQALSESQGVSYATAYASFARVLREAELKGAVPEPTAAALAVLAALGAPLGRRS